jgi:hypothetical protein
LGELTSSMFMDLEGLGGFAEPRSGMETLVDYIRYGMQCQSKVCPFGA